MVIDQELINKAFKFAVVGFSAFVIDFSTVYILKEKVKTNKYIANTVSFILSATFNFELNRAWSFSNHNPDVATQAIKFALSMTAGLGIATGLIYIFNDKMKLNFYISKLMAVSIVMIWNFGMANLVIFGSK